VNHAIFPGECRLSRLATIDYLPWPGLGHRDQMTVVRDLILDDAEFDHEDYDRDRWPVWREWAAGAARIPSARSRWSGSSCSACWAGRTPAERFMTFGSAAAPLGCLT
jgi:hypothetical protein